MLSASRLVGQVLDLMTAGRAPPKSTEKTRFANESPILVQPYGVVPSGCARL
jgi:hypothetical protein